MKYYCEDCGELFDEDDIVEKNERFTVEYWGSDVTCDEFTHRCPYCNSEEIEEAVQCECCGEWLKPEDLYDFGLYCKNCIEEMKEKAKKFKVGDIVTVREKVGTITNFDDYETFYSFEILTDDGKKDWYDVCNIEKYMNKGEKYGH